MRAFIVLAVVIALAVGPAAQEQVYTPGGNVTAPKLSQEVKPQYTLEAQAARVEGTVRMDCVVGPDGTVADARINESLHPDLDAEALKALAQWRFVPGTKDGKPVAVRVDVEMTFTLRDAAPAVKGPRLGSAEVQVPGKEVTTPVLVSDTKPRYTLEALRANVQGRVRLECVVLPDGTVGDVRVVEPLHASLDEESVRSLRKWTFKPGTKAGVAVPVRIEVEMAFSIGSGRRKSGER